MFIQRLHHLLFLSFSLLQLQSHLTVNGVCVASSFSHDSIPYIPIIWIGFVISWFTGMNKFYLYGFSFSFRFASLSLHRISLLLFLISFSFSESERNWLKSFRSIVESSLFLQFCVLSDYGWLALDIHFSIKPILIQYVIQYTIHITWHISHLMTNQCYYYCHLLGYEMRFNFIEWFWV